MKCSIEFDERYRHDVPDWLKFMHESHGEGAEIKTIERASFDPSRHCSSCRKTLEDYAYGALDSLAIGGAGNLMHWLKTGEKRK